MTVDLKKLTSLAEAVRAKTSKRPEQHQKPWYSVKNVASGVTEVYIYEDIGAWGISSSDFVAEWEGITSANINLRINSNGGSIFDGVAIFNAVKRKSKGGGGNSYVTSIVDGVAASAASYIALAADRVEMEKMSRMMIHDGGAGFYAEGSLQELRRAQQEFNELVDLLDDLSNMIAQVYVDKAGGTVEEWRALMSTDKWYSAEQAIDAQLVDGIVGEAGDTAASLSRSIAVKDVAPPTAWDVEGLVNALKGAFA